MTPQELADHYVRKAEAIKQLANILEEFPDLRTEFAKSLFRTEGFVRNRHGHGELWEIIVKLFLNDNNTERSAAELAKLAGVTPGGIASSLKRWCMEGRMVQTIRPTPYSKQKYWYRLSDSYFQLAGKELNGKVEEDVQ